MRCHAFNIEDANRHGVDAAIILHNLRFWLDHNKANRTHINDGYVWSYNSARAFADLFPYWSSNKIQKTLKKLENEGVIIVGNYNKMNYDKTKWYTLPEYSLQPNGSMVSANPLNGSSQKAQPIPDVNTDVISNEINEHFSKEKRIDVFSLDGYEFCKESYRYLNEMDEILKSDRMGSNIYIGGLTIDQLDSCEDKLREVLDEPRECPDLIYKIYQDRNMGNKKSVSLPYILMAFTDTEEFSHIAINCSDWLE